MHTQLLRISLAPIGQRDVSAAGRLPAEATGGLAMPDKIDLGKDSAHVRLELLGPAPLAPHFQLRISGMSSPYCRM